MGAGGQWLVGSEDLDQAEAEAMARDPAAAAAAGGGVGAGGWGGEGEGPVGPAGSEMSGGSMEVEAADAVLVDPLAARWVEVSG
jgi:hypothetical protein